MENKIRIFKIEETMGGLPYTVTWISLDGRLSSSSYSTYEEAKTHFDNLSALGRGPSFCLNIKEIDANCKGVENE